MNDNDLFDELIEVPPVGEKGVPLFLKLIYIILPIGGVIAFFLFWNGSKGWFYRGSWKELQQAAQTTYPFSKKTNHPKEIIIETSEGFDSSNL